MFDGNRYTQIKYKFFSALMKTKKSTELQGFTIGYVEGRHQIVLCHASSNENGQQCELHKVCGDTIHLGEVACIQRGQYNGKPILKACRLRDAMKSCSFGYVDVSSVNDEIVSYFDGKLAQVVSIDEDELESAQNPNADGVIKLIVIGTQIRSIMY